MKKPELLAPAGDLEKLKFAYLYGADACYIGGEQFSLRNNTANFSPDQMREAVKLAHSLGKKLYLALNIFAHNADIEALRDYLKEISDIEFDAFIVSDLGVISLCREMLPHMPLHISTQANTTNGLSLAAWRDMGAERAVLARELTIDEITEVSKVEGIETEIFIHGAMCVSYSGRCLLSNFMLGRDANQGNCAHPCRWEYAVLEERNRQGQFFGMEEDERGAYIMNSKDLCLLPCLPEIIESGVSSFKIEGRNKSAYYVANAVRIYRAAIDAYFDDENIYYCLPEWTEELNALGNRGYTIGFLHGKPNEDAFCYETSESSKDYVFAAVVDSCDGENLSITQRNHLQLGDILEILLPDGTNIDIPLTQMFNEEGESIEAAPHPKQKVKIPCELTFPIPAVARRKHR